MPKVSLLNDPLRYGGGLARFAAALLLIAFALPFIPAAEAQTGIGTITTVAGTGEGSFGGDGGPAVRSQLREPRGVAVDGAGNLYIADSQNNRIRKVDSTGTITTVAGTGAFGFSGDGGPASEAQLYSPHSVTVDGAGNLYIADSGNHRIRKVDSRGTITTVAGTGFGFSSGDGGPAVEARLSYPEGVALDGAGNLYIADSGNSRIRKVDSRGTITTIAGTGERGFSGDGGPAVRSQLYFPSGVAVDGAGNLYIGDLYNNRIRKVDSRGTITTIAGTGESGFSGDGGPAIAAQFNSPTGVALDGAGNLYIGDLYNHRIRKVDSRGTITTIAGKGVPPSFSGDGGPATEAHLYAPWGVAVDGAGNLYIADTSNNRIRKLIPGGSEWFSISAATPYSLTVEWREPENTGSAITDYDVRYREVGSGGDFTDARHEGTARTATLTGLRPGTAYEVQVRATNATGTGAWSQLGVGRTSPLQTGDQIYYFPHLAAGASWQTTITYINYSSQQVSCTTEFFSDQGTPLLVSFADRGTVVSRSDVLPPQGSVHQETNVGLTLAPGWARTTCSGPVTASLLFRQYNSAGVPVAEAGVNATRVAATRFVVFAEQGVGKAGTGVAYANPSATAALVTFTAKDAEGRVLARVDRTLLAGGHDAQNMASLFGLSSFSGSLEITSTEPIVSLSLNFEAAPVFSSLPPGEVDAAAQGATTYYFPHLAVGASWQTTITYINYSSQQVSCTTEFISDHGSPLLVSFADRGTVISRRDVLPAGGSVHQETNVDLSAPLAPGWAQTTCSGPVKASLLFRQYNSAGVPVAEAGVNATRVAATRFVTFAEQGEGKSGTGVAYANPSATAAHVTFTARDTEGQVLASVVRTLLAEGHDAQNMASLFGLPSFSGSLEITSTEPIVSLSLNFEAAPVFSSLPPGEVDAAPDVPGMIPMTGAPDLVVQIPFVPVSDSAPAVGANFILSVTVRNVGDAEASATTLRYYRSNDPTISSSDTPVGTDVVSALAAFGASAESIRLTAPASAGTYYYGACVDPVSGESRTGNNCSQSVRVTVSGGSSGGNSGAGKMYWTDWGTDKIQRANLDGSGVEDLVTSGLGSPRDLALDLGAGKMYWVDVVTDKIQRANLDGSGVEDLLTSGLSYPLGLELDLGAGKMYWTDLNTRKIQRANLDGSGVEDLVTSGLISPLGLALDPGAGKMYWTDGQTDKIQRANLDGSGVEDLVTSGLSGPVDLELDLGAGKMYWTDSGTDKIQRANLDGSGVEDLVTSGLSFPYGLELDPGAGKMYWTDSGTDKIQRANLDGSGVEDLVTSGLITPTGLALDTSGGGGSSPPDLVVETPSVSVSTLSPGQSFDFRATVRNQGGLRSVATTLRYYRSNDSTISSSDTPVGTDAVSALAASGASAESIRLTAPASAGIYYYGACADAVSGESQRGNNCSQGVRVTVSGGSSGAGKMYWTDIGTRKIQRANLDGSGVEDLVTSGLISPHGLALDLGAGKMYWTDRETDKVQRANLDGSGVEDLVTSGLIVPSALALDPGAGKMYWTDSGTDKIQRANLDGSGVEDLVTAGLRLPTGLALDPGAGKMYWVDRWENKIQRANLDGSGVEDLLTSTSGLSSPLDLALDLGAGKMYWTDSWTDKIQRANLDGSGVEDLVTSTSGLVWPRDLALDLGAGKMYWTDVGADKIQRANLDGSGVEDLVTSGLITPTGLALDTSGGGGSSPPDLVVETPSVSVSTLSPGQSFDFRATVRNQGGLRSVATTLRYYRSNDSTISSSDTPVGTDAVSALAASGASAESIRLTAPASAGIYYYGACADAVSGESQRGNNCSQGVRVTVSGGSSGAGKMYWTDIGTRKIQRANLDGSGVEDLVTSGLISPHGLALDLGAGKMYWTDRETDKVQRANLDGSGVEDLVTSGLSGPHGLALDPGAGKMYWVDSGTDKIQRANLDGSGVEDLVTAGLRLPTGLALDPGAGKMYWVDLWYRYILRANLDGSAVEDLVTSGLATAFGLALDLGAGKMYWTDYWYRYILRANLDGTGVEHLVISGLADPRGLALDPGAGKMYWTDQGTNKIQRANLDGSWVEDLVTASGLRNPFGLALDTSGAGGGGAGTTPDLVVQTPSASPSSPNTGQTFTLSATVRNQGNAQAAATTLRYYRSTDAGISTGDTEVGTDAVGGLSASGASYESIDLAAPLVAGTYYYGACVDPVAEETATGNNCSSAVAVIVSDGTTPDLVVQTPSASPSSPNTGQTFTLSATVRNQGNAQAAATTLRYYRSTDAGISTGDTEVGTDAVGGLSASGASYESIDLAAPLVAGTYYYGACVDPVAGETATGNCSSAVAVIVSVTTNTATFINLDAANDDAWGIAFANGKFYVVDTKDDKVYAYTYNGQRAAASDFNLDEANNGAAGIAFANNKFYVVDLGDDKVYAYTYNGQRAAASDFNLDEANEAATGITFANGWFCVVDATDRKVYTYLSSGARPPGDFDLDQANNYPTGIVFANGKFYVVDRSDDKVYVYTDNGQRAAAADFNLYRTIRSPGGIVFANGWFYVVDEDDGAIPHPASGY